MNLMNRSYVYTLKDGVIDGFQNDLRPKRMLNDDTCIDNFNSINPILSSNQIELSTISRIDDTGNNLIFHIIILLQIIIISDISISNKDNGNSSQERIYFTNYDIQNFMKPIRSASQGDFIDKRLDMLTENYQSLAQKINEIDSKLDKIIVGILPKKN